MGSDTLLAKALTVVIGFLLITSASIALAVGNSAALMVVEAELEPLSARGSIEVRSGIEWTAFGFWAEAQQSNDDHGFGFELAVAHLSEHGVVPELRAGGRGWNDGGAAPVFLGLRVDLWKRSLFTLSPYAGVGPVLAWGNDWGGIFAAFDAGMRISTGVTRAVRLSFGLSYGQLLVFHPDWSGYASVTGGIGMVF